jgi:hypothetical protein
MIEVHGSEKSSNSIRYAMLMNCMNDVCADMSRDASKSKFFIEEVQKLHARLMTENGKVNKDGSSSLNLKDPPVIKKSSSKKQKAKETEEVTVPKTATVPKQNVDVWIHEDGTVSKSTQVPEKFKTSSRPSKKKKQSDGSSSSLQDPPVSNSLSVNKGNRWKPQSEKNTKRKKTAKND